LPETYAILFEGFRARLGGEGPEAGFDVRLDVLHPGPGFADDLASVMSYEDVIDALRRVCADSPADAVPADLARDAVRRLAALPKVRSVRLRSTVVSPKGETLGCEVVSESA
jgi:7,8-dihydroneopterin aldolase/epimerase/oxygenase